MSISPLCTQPRPPTMKNLCQLTLTILLALPFTLAQFEYLQCADDVPPDYPNPQATWSSWTKLPGPDLSSEPTAVTTSGDDIQVFVCARSQEAGRWINFGDSWRSYHFIQSGISSVPHPIVSSNGRMHLFSRSLDESLVSIPCFQSRCTFHWTDHGGVLLHAPTGVSFEANRNEVFVVNTAQSVSWRTFDDDSRPVGSWRALPNPGRVIHKVAAVSRVEGSIDLFGIGPDNRIYHRTYTHSNERWTNWVRTHETRVSSAPAVVSVHPLRIDLFVRGQANDVLQTTWVNGKWSGFSSLGGVVTSAPGAVARTRGRIDVFARGTDMKLYQTSFA